MQLDAFVGVHFLATDEGGSSTAIERSTVACPLFVCSERLIADSI